MAQQSSILADVARTDTLLCLDMYRHRRSLHHLTKNDDDYKEVEQLFIRGWLHPDKPIPKVASIFRILSPYPGVGKYANYRYAVALKRKRQTNNVERLLFHGTTRQCLLGETRDSVLLCGKSECSMCTIIANSYDIAKAGQKNKFQRFGTGIYTTACSSKADSYSSSAQLDSPFRFLVLNRVVVGKERRVHHSRHRHFDSKKFDSLHALPGDELNYEETVVYTNDAILPAYLIVYYDPSITPPPKRRFADKVKDLFHMPLVAQ